MRPVCFILILLMLAGCASNPKSHVSLSAEEIQIGEQINTKILSAFYPYTEPTAVAYVNKVGKAVAVSAERTRPLTEERALSMQRYFSAIPLAGKAVTTNRKEFMEMTRGIRKITPQVW